MKKVLTAIAIMAFGITSFAQTPTAVDYQKKAKTQRIIGYSLAGVGAATIITGLIIAGKDDNAVGTVVDGTAAIVVGGVLGLASIPMFILAGKNQKKANGTAYLQIGVQKINSSYLNVSKQKAMPALSLNIPLLNSSKFKATTLP